MQTPSELGFHFPAEWEKHEATWLTWPYLDDSFPGKLDLIFKPYIQFINILTKGEKVRINVANETEEHKLHKMLLEAGVDVKQVETFRIPSNDVWCRDHGPVFVINPSGTEKKAIVNWVFNAWGNKYPSELDHLIASRVAQYLSVPVFNPEIIMEGGSVDFNGIGTILTTTSCLLNKNRNPDLTQREIEQYLVNYYGMQQVLWLDEGIAGDDTDGHIDDITRFVNDDTVVTAVETDDRDDNYRVLQNNLQKLKKFRLINNKQLNIVELPMPQPVFWEGRRLPASYANFYISNDAVIVPLFHCIQDDVALEILSGCFPEREVTGIDSRDLVWGLGSFHCLSQQEPFVK
jgi:agmatine deiminase